MNKAINQFALIMIIIGGINLGILGIFDLDLIAAFFGVGSIPARIFYVTIGLSGIWALLTTFVIQRRN